MRRVGRILNGDRALEILPVIALSVKRACPTVNHITRLQRFIVGATRRSRARTIIFDHYLLIMTQQGEVLHGSPDSGAREPERPRSISTYVAIMPVYGIINYKSVTTVAPRVTSAVAKFARLASDESLPKFKVLEVPDKPEGGIRRKKSVSDRAGNGLRRAV
jgi:hypothetical protein